MITRVFVLVFLLINCCFLPAQTIILNRANKINVDCFKEFTTIVESKILPKYTADDVLFAYDTDCTLLKAKQPDGLGDVPWFDWQAQKISKDKFSDLLKVQFLLFALGKMESTEPEIPAILNKWHMPNGKGYKAVILTARGYNFENFTLDTLLNNNMYFDQYATLPPLSCFQPYLPYQTGKPAVEFGLRADQITKDPRPITFNNGIILIAGQNKGIMLRSLLYKTHRLGKIKAIIFLDDTEKNSDDMIAAFSDMNINIYSFVYHHEDAYKKTIIENQNLQKKLSKNWDKIRHLLKEIYESDCNIPLDYQF